MLNKEFIVQLLAFCALNHLDVYYIPADDAVHIFSDTVAAGPEDIWKMPWVRGRRGLDTNDPS